MNNQMKKRLISLALLLVVALGISLLNGEGLGGFVNQLDSMLDAGETLPTEPAPAPETPDPAPEVQPQAPPQAETPSQPEEPAKPAIDEDGSYTGKEDVALYIHTYGKLPDNFITKDEARKLGWSGGGLEGYAPGKCIGGDAFYNSEGLLPKKSGRKYTECDIDTLGASSRGAKRIVFSNDGLIYYTEDHYESFELLYGGND